MKFFCNGMELSNATNIVSKAVAANKNIPILEGIMVKAQGKTVTLSAYNQEIYIEKTILAEIFEEGEALLNGKLFNDCANKISSVSRVCIEKGFNGKITIGFNDSMLELNYYDATGFAELGEYHDENSFKIKESELKELLERVIFCVSTGNESRMLLKSCSLEVKDGIIEAVCLDGFRLAISQKSISNEVGKFRCVVLGKIISDIIKIISDSEDVVKIINDKKAMIVDLGHTKIRTTLVESDFYNYKSNLPSENVFELVVNKSELEGALNRAAIISRETHNNGVSLQIGAEKLNISCENEKGRINESVNCKFNGESTKIILNNKYLNDDIARIKEDFVKIVIEDNRQPVVVKRMDGDDYRCVILPIRILA